MGADFPHAGLTRPVLEAVQRLRGRAEAYRITVAQLTRAWVLRHPHVTATIVGATGRSRWPPMHRQSKVERTRIHADRQMG